MKRVLWLGLGSVLAVAITSSALASHVVQQSATPIHVSVVPFYAACPPASANAVHEPPLPVTTACTPPDLFPLGPGGPSAVSGPEAISYGEIDVIEDDPDTVAVDPDVVLTGVGTDVQNLLGGDYDPAPGHDLTSRAQIRVTDHDCLPASSVECTVIDFPFPVNVHCFPTANATVGSTCKINGTANAMIPGLVKSGQDGIVQIARIVVRDAGADGLPDPPAGGDDVNFAQQGVFIP